MSVLFTDVVTVYNHRYNEESERESWSRSVIRGVQWTHNHTDFAVQGKSENVSKVEQITIDFQRNYGNKQYLPPQEYEKCEAPENYWTLKAGEDLLVLGESNLKLESTQDVRTLKESFQYVVAVTEISDNRNRPRLKHIKVVGK